LTRLRAGIGREKYFWKKAAKAFLVQPRMEAEFFCENGSIAYCLRTVPGRRTDAKWYAGCIKERGACPPGEDDRGEL